MKTKIIVLILVGLLIRVVLSFSTFHPDIRAFNLGGQLVAEGHILDLYDYLATLPKDSEVVRIFQTDLFIYPPLVYLTHGIFNFIFSGLLGLKVVNLFLIENKNTFFDPGFGLHLFLLKFPYLIFDLIGGIFLVKLFETQKQKLLAAILWAFNPVIIYATYMMGQFDLIPTVFTIMSLYFASKKKLYLAAILLGVGIAFKIYPLFLLLPLMFLGKNFIQKAVIFILGVIPYLVITLPYLSSSGYRSSALVAGQTLKSLYAQVPVSGGESIFLFLFILIFVYLYFYYHPITTEDLWKRSLIVLLIFFIFTHYHPQWFVWITPFLIIDLVKSNLKNWVLHLILLLTFVASLFFFNSSLTTALFAPVSPILYESKTIWEQLNLKIDFNLARGLIQSVFAAASAYLIYLHINAKSKTYE